MSPDFQALMRKATELTRGGKLAAAQAAIQRALGRFGAGPAPTPPSEIVDVVATVVDDAPAAAAAAGSATGFASGVPPLHARGPAFRPFTIDPAVFRPAPAGPRAEPRAGAMHRDTHAAAGLRCEYALYVPPQSAGQALPLLVMLHGCTQDPDDFAAGTRMNELAQAQGFIVLYPAQSAQMNPQRCWNWFKHNHQRRGSGEPALLASLTQEVMRRHAVDPRRVYVAGLSAGGAMAAVLARCYPELYAAVGVHSGLAPGVATDLPSALAAMNGATTGLATAPSDKPVIVFHGDADTTVHPQNAAAVVASSTGAPPVAEPVAADRPGQRRATRRLHRTADGRVAAEHWTVHGAPHAWSGGSPAGSYTDASGPDASAEMLRFFLEHPQVAPAKATEPRES